MEAVYRAGVLDQEQPERTVDMMKFKDLFSDEEKFSCLGSVADAALQPLSVEVQSAAEAMTSSLQTPELFSSASQLTIFDRAARSRILKLAAASRVPARSVRLRSERSFCA